MSKIVFGVGAALAAGACAFTAITAVTPNWFHATYPDQDCPVGEIGLFSSNWSPVECAGVNENNETRISGPSGTLDTNEYWPLFPLQYPQVNGNPLKNITAEFVDCATSVDEVYDYVLVVLAEAGLVQMAEGFALLNYTPEKDEASLRAAFDLNFPASLPPGLTAPEIAALADAAWAQAYPYIQVCAADETAKVSFANCLTHLQALGALDNLGTAFNTDAPADKEAAIALCEDDNIDHDNLMLCQKLIPAGAAMGGLAAVLLIVAAVAAPPAALVAALLALGDGGMMMASLLTLAGTPAAAGVGEECTDPNKTCYTQESNGLFGLITVILSGVAAVMAIIGFVLAKKESSNALVNL